jgi:ElaB/YqjD/DUF883 family membrane-anchored ribosome-binding protein
MGQTPDEIRQDIEETRERMSEKADALAYKADVPARTRDRFDDAKESVMSKIHSVTDRVTGRAGEAGEDLSDRAAHTRERVSEGLSHGADEAKHRARQAKGLAQDNPLGLAIGAVAMGFLAGLVIPTTRVEDERLGEVGERVRDRAKDLGQEALERGKEVAQTARDAAGEQAKDLASSAGQQAQDVTSGSGSGQHVREGAEYDEFGNPRTTHGTTPTFTTP